MGGGNLFPQLCGEPEPAALPNPSPDRGTKKTLSETYFSVSPTNFLGPLDDAFDLIPSSIFSHTRGTPTVRVGLTRIFHHQFDLFCGASEYVR